VLDLDSLLNFLYIVAFLAAMVLPAFQKQRREEARKRAEELRRGSDVPTVEERDPSDVPEPVIRRKPEPATEEAEPVKAAAEPTEHRTASDLPSPVSATPMRDSVAQAAIDAADFPQLEDAPSIGSIGDEITFGSIGELESETRAAAALLPTPAGTGAPVLSASARGLGTIDREALRRAILWREVLDKPVSLRQQQRTN
jgi:hypothetical protein